MLGLVGSAGSKETDVVKILSLIKTVNYFYQGWRRHTTYARYGSSDVCSSDLQSKAMGEILYPKVGPYDQDDYVRSIDRLLSLHTQVVSNGYGPAFRSEERRVGKEWGSRREADA